MGCLELVIVSVLFLFKRTLELKIYIYVYIYHLKIFSYSKQFDVNIKEEQTILNVNTFLSLNQEFIKEIT